VLPLLGNTIAMMVTIIFKNGFDSIAMVARENLHFFT